jgi:hypothetical protein
MIECSYVYDLLLAQIRADKRGLSISISEFNDFARIVNERVYAKYYDDFENSTDNISAMAGFKVLNYTVALTAGVGSLPSDYYDLIGKPRTSLAGVTKRVDLVSSLELDDRLDDYLTQPTTSHPCAILAGTDANGYTKIVVYPTTITSVDVDYLQEATTPFLDYYVNDTTLVTTYMAESATVAVPSGSTYRTGTAGGGAGIVSQTVNFEWDISDTFLILSMFASMIGLTLNDSVMMQVGSVNEEKK